MKKNNRAVKLCIGLSFITSAGLMIGCSNTQANESVEETQAEEISVDEEEVNRLGISKDLLREIDQAVNSYSYIDSLNGQILSAEQVCSTEIEPYRSAIKYMNGTIQLDTALAREIADKNINEVEEKITELLDSDFDKYCELDESDKEKNADDTEDKEKIAERIDYYNMFNTILAEAACDFHKWTNVQNVSESGDRFTMCGDAWKLLYEACLNGKIYSKKAQAAIDLIIPDNIDRTNEDSINAYLMILKNYLADNGSGVNNFIADSISNGLMVSLDGGNCKVADGISLSQFAEKLNLTGEVVRAIWGELEMYGWNFDWHSEGSGATKGMYVSTKEKVDDLSNQIEKKKNAGEDTSKLESQKVDCQNELDSIKERLKEEN